MKPYFRSNEFLTPIREVGVFVKALCGHNFCTTEIFFGMAYFFALINPFLCGGQNFIKLFFRVGQANVHNKYIKEINPLITYISPFVYAHQNPNEWLEIIFYLAV